MCVDITPEGATWDPYDPSYSLIEEALIDINGGILVHKYVDKISVEHDEEKTAILSSLNVVLVNDI